MKLIILSTTFKPHGRLSFHLKVRKTPRKKSVTAAFADIEAFSHCKKETLVTKYRRPLLDRFFSF